MIRDWFGHQFEQRLRPRNRERAETRGAAVDVLGEVTESTDVSPETEAETIRALRFPVTLYGCGRWTGKTADRKT